MARVWCTIRDASGILLDDHGDPVVDRHGHEVSSPAIEVECSRCGATVRVGGTSDRSAKRGCVMLREQCGRRGIFYDFDPVDLP